MTTQWRIYPLAKSAMAPLWSNNFFDIVRNWKTWFGLPLCVSTSVQRTFGPHLFETLNTPMGRHV